jgi:hypothetical protein
VKLGDADGLTIACSCGGFRKLLIMNQQPTKTADEIINEIAELLRESDGAFIQAVANFALKDRVHYLEDSVFEYWTCIEDGPGLYCRRISENVFEFFDPLTGKKTINLATFSEATIETCINLFGYTLYESQDALVNIKERFRDDANWWIARWFMESDLPFTPELPS